jgi:hypothetical protein
MASDEEKKSLVKRQQNSIFSYSKLAVTPEFGELEWLLLNGFCLLTITLMATWQVTGKVAMSLKLDSTEEVCAMTDVRVPALSHPFLTEISKAHISVHDALSWVGALFPLFSVEERNATAHIGV